MFVPMCLYVCEREKERGFEKRFFLSHYSDLNFFSTATLFLRFMMDVSITEQSKLKPQKLCNYIIISISGHLLLPQLGVFYFMNAMDLKTCALLEHFTHKKIL